MMGCSSCRLEPWRLMWAVVGIVAFLLDVSTDLWAAVRYLQAGEYIWFGTVLVLLILASVLIQIFSWCWYESDKELKESPELKIIHWLLTSEGRCWLGLLHVLQLGYFVRYLEEKKAPGPRHCTQCSSPFSAAIKHDCCLKCLGPDHRPRECDFCRAMGSRALKSCEQWFRDLFGRRSAPSPSRGSSAQTQDLGPLLRELLSHLRVLELQPAPTAQAPGPELPVPAPNPALALTSLDRPSMFSTSRAALLMLAPPLPRPRVSLDGDPRMVPSSDEEESLDGRGKRELDARKWDTWGKKVYSAASLAVRVSSYMAHFSQYNHELWSEVAILADLLPENRREDAGCLAADGLEISKALMQGAWDLSNTAARGGHLSAFFLAWEAITSDRWVLELIEKGYSIQFEGDPPGTFFNGYPVSVRTSDHLEALESELSSVLASRAVEPVPEGQLIVCLHVCFPDATLSASFLAITWSVFDYHQSLRSYLEDSHELGYLASAVYFLWNLLLLTPRILCIAIFTSQFHYFTLIHVVAVWIPMFIWATQQKTDFMEKPASEWFYRAVVAIIWYFSWFNTAKGKTLTRVIIYYFFVTIDCTILLAWIWWYKGPKAINRYLVLIILGIAVSYMLGLVLRCVYYQWFHPKVRMQKPATSDEVDSEKQSLNSMYRCAQMESGPHAPTNKRMQALARNFFNGNNDNRVCRNGLNMDMRTTSL
nr:PREDICTED: uncharacterized protein LOC102358470 [Latimeria chalumnae]|eukprot:XP_014353641.1 PREDICTED: uncharacterized protein LOC102358470 [Latimeria chalumnae]